MGLISWVILLNVVHMVISQHSFPNDHRWKHNGTVILKAAADTSLCARTEMLNKEKVFLKLVKCELEYPSYLGDKRFDVGFVDGKYNHLRTTLYPPDVDPDKGNYPAPEYGCFYAGIGGDSIVLTDRCNPDNPWHQWRFNEVSKGRVQWIHKETETCVAAPTITNGTDLKTRKCDENDITQIWEAQFLDYDWKWDDDGKVVFKSADDQTLCMTTDQLDENSSIINLLPCSSNNEKPYAGTKKFRLGKIPEDQYELQTVHLPINSAYGVHACIYTGYLNGSTNNVRMYTKKCNYNDGLQYFRFIKVSSDRLQIFHSATQKCIKANENKTTVVTTDCDKNDVNQMWIPMFSKH